MKLGINVGIIKCHHSAVFERNRSKDIGSKRKKLNYGKNALA